MPARLASALAATAALASLASPALAEEEDLRDLVERQRKRIDDLERRLAEVEGRPAAEGSTLEAAVERYLSRREAEGGAESYGVGSVLRPANPRFRMGGYTTVLFRYPDDPDENSSFEGLRFVPQFSFDISKGIDFAAEVEFEHGGAADFLDDNEVIVEYAETRFHVSDALVPKAGILLIPFLRYNLYHDDPIWNLQDRPFTATRVFHAAFQQPGVGLEGVLPLGGGHSFNYNVALTNGPDDEVTNDGFEDSETPFLEDNNNDKAVWARVGVAPRVALLDAADFGLSFATARMDPAGDVRMTGWGLDGKVSVGRFDLLGEWAAFHYARPSYQPAATFPRQTNGGFLQVDTHLLRGLPASENGLVGPSSELILAVRIEWCDLNERVHGASMNDDSRALTIGLAFRFTPKTVVRLERKEERTDFNGPGAEDRGQWVLSLSTYF
jgi:hypothetical protein